MAKAKTIEDRIAEIIADYEKDGEPPISTEEAREIAEMEMNAENNRHYEQSAEPKKKERKVPVRKADTAKIEIVNKVAEALAEYNPTIAKEGELTFGEFTIKVIRHRPPKK